MNPLVHPSRMKMPELLAVRVPADGHREDAVAARDHLLPLSL